VRYLFPAASLLFLSALTLPTSALAQSGTAGLSISTSGYVQVSGTRVDRTHSYFTYTAVLNNTSGGRTGVTATITSLASNVTVVAGQNILQFSPVPAGLLGMPSAVTSSNTFTILVDLSVPFDWSQVSWSFNNPFAAPGPNQTASVLSTVTLNGSGSTNPAGIGSLTYSWAIQSAPAGSTATLSNGNNVIATLVPDVIGTYVVALTVSNGFQYDTNSVTITTTDAPPTAKPGPGQTVSVNSIVHLDGTKSTDANGQPLSYSWSFVTIPNGSAAFLSNPRSPIPTFTADVSGSWIVGLVVNDGTLNSSQATVTITTGNTPPVAVATATPQTVNLNGLVQLDGSRSTDVDGNPLTYAWSLNTTQAPGSLATLSAANIVNPTFTVDVPGTYVAQLIVHDGAIASQPVTVTVTTNAGLAPTASAAATQTKVAVGSIVQLQGSGTDPQSLPLTYHWTLPTFPTGSAAASLFPSTAQNPTFVADLPGVYGAQLVVNDSSLSSGPATVTITSTSTPPVAVPTTTTPSVALGSVVSLSGSQSIDPDNDPITGYAWSLSSPIGSRSVLTGANSLSATFSPDIAGTYVAQLIVSDRFGSSNPATVSISAGQMTIALTPNPLDLSTSPQALTINLSPGAGGNPVNVNLTGFDPAIVSLPSNTVQIPANSSSANVTVTPLSLGNTSITASAPGYQSGSAPVVVATPTITLTFNNNATSVPLTQTIGGTVTLSAPAPPGGTSVTLVDVQDFDSGQIPGLVTFNPTSVAIPAGSTTGTFTITGAALGSVEILPGAPGYARVNFIPFNVATLGTLEIPTNFSVPAGQSASLNIELSSPAPAGGATVTLQSGNLAILTISPSTVTISAGASTPAIAPQVTGVATGSATINASSPAYTADTETANVTIATPISVPCPAVTAGEVNVPFSSQVSAASGVSPYTYSVVGTLPNGLTLNTSTGAITGTPLASGSFSIQAKDSAGGAGTSCTFTINSALSLPCPVTTAGQVNSAFSSQLSAGGGVTPYSYSVVGTLPNGLTLSPSTGSITGTATVSGNFSVQVKDAIGVTATSCTLTIGSALSLPCPTTTSGQVNSAFSSQLSAGGGVSPYIYSVVGTLPTGLTLSPSTGAISGTPTVAGNFSVQVKDASGSTATSCTFTIAGPLTLPCPATTSGQVNSTFSSQVSAAGGVSPYTYSVVGTLPTGLTLNPSTGAITGTPTAGGTFSIQVKDSAGTTATSCTFSISSVLTLACPATTSGQINVSFSSQVSASGGVSPYTYAVVGTLPTGLTLNASTGAITGTPTVTGTFNVQAKDSAGNTATSCLFSVLPAPSISISFDNNAGGVGLTHTIGATITLSSAAPQPNGTTVTLSTNPFDSGSVSFSTTTVAIPAGSTTGTFMVTGAQLGTAGILANAPGSPTASATILVVMLGSISISNNLTVPAGQSVPLTIQLSSPAPVGGVTITLQSGNTNKLTVSPTTVSIDARATTPSVAPQVTGVAAGSITLTASSGGYNGDTETVIVTNATPISLPCPAIAAGDVNSAFSSQVAAVGGVSPYTYSVVGTLPNGLTLNPSSGTITGTPLATGSFSIQAKDAAGSTAASCTFTINSALSLPCPSTTSGQVNSGFSSQVSAGGGASPYTYSVVGTLPAGLTLNSSSGAITGTPTVAGNFNVQVKDATGATATSCALTIAGPLSLPCPATSTGQVNAAFSSQVSAGGGVSPYTYSVVGTLPTGLTLNPSTGAITGTPTIGGTFSIQVKDSAGSTVISCTFTISSALSLPCPATTSGQVNVSFSGQVSALGGISPYSYAVVGLLPTGLTLNASTGTISGTPTVTGSFNIQVKDSAGNTATSCSFAVLPAPTISISFDNNAGGVGLTHNIGGTITLSSPAPQPNGTTVTLSTNPFDSGLVNFSTMSVTIPAGNTIGTFTVTGAQLGTAGILANAPGSPTASVTILVVMLGSISISNNLSVTAGQSVPLMIQLSAPAPVGGVTITLQSGDSNTLTVSPTTVTIDARSKTPSVAPQVTGVAAGSTTITASSGGYNGDAETVIVTTPPPPPM